MKKGIGILLLAAVLLAAGCGEEKEKEMQSLPPETVVEAEPEEESSTQAELWAKEEVQSGNEIVQDTVYMTLDLSGPAAGSGEGPAVTPLEMEIVYEENNGVSWANDWYDSNNLSLPMVGPNWNCFEDDNYGYKWEGETLGIYEKNSDRCLYVLEYPSDQWYITGNNARLENGIFYGTSVYNGYATPNTCFLFAYDLTEDRLLWRSTDQTCNTMNFVVKGDIILCGYGFTDEDDYLYQLNRHTGEVIGKLKVKSQPNLLVEQDGILSVHTYSYDYVIELNEKTEAVGAYGSIEELRLALQAAEEEAEALENSINNDILNQMELNEKSDQLFRIWDSLLNDVWGYLRSNLDAEEMERLTKEQLEWIGAKEQSMDEAGAEVEGGSMYGMVVALTGAELTRERVFELVELAEANS